MSDFKKGKAPFVEDFMRMAEGAFGTVAGMRSEWETMARQQGERILSNMNVPTREELEVVKALAAKVLLRLEQIEKRLDALDKKGSAKKPDAAPAKTKAKPKTQSKR